VASLITPFLLGASFGVLTKGGIRVAVDPSLEVEARSLVWLTPYCVTNGLLAISTCAFLAAVYLTNETSGALRDDFRRRAILAGTSTAALAAIVLPLAWVEANWFVRVLLDWRTLPIVLAGILCFAGAAWSVFARRYALSRAFAILEIVLLLVGWGWAQYPYLIYPDLRLAQAAAPTSTLQFMVLSLPLGLAMLLPSLWLLLRVFKRKLADAS
jgi:cytochrome d ubiquinol oxidase subunit II